MIPAKHYLKLRKQNLFYKKQNLNYQKKTFFKL